jgi:hypothetical protein
MFYLIKTARYGAGVLFKQPGGKYLLEKNHPDPGMPKKAVGKLRPAGGGASKRDANLKETIIREIGEEFGLDESFVRPRLKLLGYQQGGKYAGCAVYEMRDHGLKPGKYQASNSDNEYVILVESDLDDHDYVGPGKEDLKPTPPKGHTFKVKMAAGLPHHKIVKVMRELFPHLNNKDAYKAAVSELGRRGREVQKLKKQVAPAVSQVAQRVSVNDLFDKSKKLTPEQRYSAWYRDHGHRPDVRHVLDHPDI